MLKIVQAPSPALSQKAKAVLKIDGFISKLIKGMKESLLAAKDPIGVGLAAPQVGKSLQIFIAKPSSKSPIQVFINPKIIQKTKISHLTVDNDRVNKLNKTIGEKSSTKLEGCLSLPNIWGEVKRDPKIKLQYQLITNNYARPTATSSNPVSTKRGNVADEVGRELITKMGTFSGFMATIIQHEMDHLQGILFPKRVLEQKGTLYKSHKNEKNEDVFEEIEI